MKKLLLTATLLAAISATAMGAGNTATDSLTVTANYIVPITVTLDTDTIDFKDVYEGSNADVQTVTANLTGETGETFDYLVSTTSDTGIVLSGATGSGTIAAGVANFSFGVDMDRSTARTDVAAHVVTVDVNYTAIDDTVVTTTGA